MGHCCAGVGAHQGEGPDLEPTARLDRRRRPSLTLRVKATVVPENHTPEGVDAGAFYAQLAIVAAPNGHPTTQNEGADQTPLTQNNKGNSTRHST
jgi:hypothetical protein